MSRRLLIMVLALLAACPAMPVGAQTAMCPAERWSAPVDGIVIDHFRAPPHVGARGNRGWEYSTEPGARVSAVGAGVVSFAGSIGRHHFVSIVHCGGLRTTYSFLAEVLVARGERVEAGHKLGLSLSTMHFGVISNGDYLDPALLMLGPRTQLRVRLVRFGLGRRWQW
jgi:murein DD-endopeptidase MepM/ murein hydrolase activator NlpD